ATRTHNLLGRLRRACGSGRYRETQCYSDYSPPSLHDVPTLLGPPQLLQAGPIVPDLGHVPDPAALELHDVDVLSRHAPARRRHWAAIPGVRALEHAERGHVVAPLIHRETPHLIAPVRHGRE